MYGAYRCSGGITHKMNYDDLEVIVKKVVAEFGAEFFENSSDPEDQEVMLENLDRAEKYVSFTINRFMTHFNSVAEMLTESND